jgi:hypothetical protein
MGLFNKRGSDPEPVETGSYAVNAAAPTDEEVAYKQFQLRCKEVGTDIGMDFVAAPYNEG